jgi:hypothetical protein
MRNGCDLVFYFGYITTRLHNEKLYALYSPHIIWVIKKKEIGEGEVVAGMVGKDMCI